MQQDQMTLAPFYKGWDRYQSLLTEAVAPLTSEQLALSTAPAMWSVGQLAAHILATRVGWFQRMVGEFAPDLAELAEWDVDDAPVRTADELVDGLNTSWDMVQSYLNQWTPAMLDDEFRGPRGPVRTRQWIIWHVLEHDIHHGGELCETLGMYGLPTPDL
jgi:uncharacterized damage-inducible protein DinB